jgi:hypothetical protein
MRYMMYYHGYGHRERARELFAELPSEARRQLAVADFRRAEAVCPNRIPIGRVVREAVTTLS